MIRPLSSISTTNACGPMPQAPNSNIIVFTPFCFERRVLSLPAPCCQRTVVHCRCISQRAAATIARARKKSEIADEWAALAKDDDVPDELDPDLQQSINEVVNKGLRYMLKGETNRLYEYRDELSKFGQYFSDRNNIAGATFVYTVYKMTEHILPEQMVNLEGIYLTAFEKMFAMLEDSGWQLQKEPKEGEELELMEEPTAEELSALGYTAQ